MQPADSPADLFSGILFDPTVGNQMSLINQGETDYNLASALTEWGHNLVLPDPHPSQLTPISSQETSHSPSVAPDSIQSTAESVTSTDDEEIICYGMLHNVDVKLVGEMRITDANLGESETGRRRFELRKQQDHILLCSRDDDKEFGYLRSGVGKTLAPLLAKSYVEFEPIVLTSNPNETIRRTKKPTKPAETMVKADINVYGPRQAAAEVGDALSRGKLWLQKSDHARREVVYDNPHFLPLKINGIQMQYRHRITKARAKQGTQPDERGGGILADEMGMGKSLSILALIAKTLDDSNDWAQQQNDSTEDKEALKHSRSTLVVVPHLKGGFEVVKYHGPGRPKDLDTILDSDIVITTYSTLTAEVLTKAKPSILHRIGWYRVVLDEAHFIRRTATAFYRVCDDLHANSRWCLTGTPIQNKLADIGALFAFIRAEPFTRASVFRKWIEAPFEQNIENPAVVKNRLVMLLEALCLRRTKDAIQLPGIRQRIRTLEFSPAEREQYENTKKTLARTLRQRAGGVEKSSKFGLFQVNMQMRLLCNHGTFQKPFSWHSRSPLDEREVVVSALGQDGQITCSGCYLPMPIVGSSWLSNSFRAQCAHVLCDECIEESSMPGAREQMQRCPVCVRWLTHARTEGRIAAEDVAVPDWPAENAVDSDYDYNFSAEGHSTKMLAIIFSCWTRTLYLLSKHLDQAKIPYLRIDGGCPPGQRLARLDQFAKDDEKRVLIMTTGTGGFGLNLTCANRVFIIELQWNPGVESQAIARAVRLGQEHEVYVTRYMIKNTVEEEMKSQQQWKMQIAALGFEEALDVIDDGGRVS
ncbi:putative DNA repair protein RAD5B [Triangularia verruculosa]|uniref:DNA repair protein RAD5B n=1 Tax=Triangularia verruculosa TaxID=2587418 RepID=A0AAN6X8W5_9PEZI|nr:putative DNA repair protein RAD5B [Triangularia verruculosa]